MQARSLISLSFFFFGLLAFAREQAATHAPLSLDALRAELAGHIQQERFRGAQWGIKIQSLATGAILFEHHSEKLLKPASNAKLYTGALALDVLGPEFRIRTSLYSTKVPRQGVLDGDLIV